ncbi:NAD(P)-dependent oxidoreductase [Rhodocytophaga aerolata]|uniref:NAD(P)-dependent oxidoreductase n=1 Tax=Rhodocytophaga aerolata TaxID=455078 RepID=A0ABT8R8G1_9BACT|nr:NAD(P)-dependent oxidoreductase [Rhodocytophaga aerolata]MDO1447639.1 NAD(P)-dependent oxidoreductase [Rhodocytophaga aerolata]
MHIGFIGLGRMGFPMAQCLLNAGFELTVYNRTSSKATPLLNAGARLANSPLETISPGGIVITMVSDDQVLEETLSEKFCQTLGKDGVHLSMSTLSLEIARKLSARQQQYGNHYVAAPVFGPPAAAAEKKLWICLSGNEEAKMRTMPILEVMSQGIYDFGVEPTAATLVKLTGNFMIQSALEAMSEGLTLAEKHGLDQKQVMGMLTDTIFACAPYKNYGKKIAEKRFDEVSFSLSLAAKDNRLVREAAAEKQLSMPLAQLVQEHFQAGLDKQRGELDMTAIALKSLESAGLAGKEGTNS